MKASSNVFTPWRVPMLQREKMRRDATIRRI
jgi:hypothetical protein